VLIQLHHCINNRRVNSIRKKTFMATPTYYPTTLTEELAAESRKSFEKIIADMTTSGCAASPVTTASHTAAKPRKHFITVRVTMPHVKKYGKKPEMSLTYGCSFDVCVGDQVRCPPTRLNTKWALGVVTDIEADRLGGYRGPVKYVAAVVCHESEKG
jgi:hypothetical protein